MELHPLTWGKCWKSMSQHGHWDRHPRTYSVSREPTWKPAVTDHLVPVPQNYGISSQIVFGQLGVWQSSNHNWKHICSKMYLSNNYVDINIYPLTMNVICAFEHVYMERVQYQMTILLWRNITITLFYGLLLLNIAWAHITFKMLGVWLTTNYRLYIYHEWYSSDFYHVFVHIVQWHLNMEMFSVKLLSENWMRIIPGSLIISLNPYFLVRDKACH